MSKAVYSNRQRAEMIKGFQAVKICPVTNGLPTTMTLAGFTAACDRCRDQDRHGYDGQRAYKYTWCDTCDGRQRPKELRIVSLSRLEAERQARRERQKRPENGGTFPGRESGEASR